MNIIETTFKRQHFEEFIGRIHCTNTDFHSNQFSISPEVFTTGFFGHPCGYFFFTELPFGKSERKHRASQQITFDNIDLKIRS